MITADVHTHTLYAHGKDTPQDMWAAAQAKGITLYGFSEHSPRPHDYNYTHEYRERLAHYFPQYVAEVQALQQEFPQQILLGMEMDWMEKERDFIEKAITAYDFDYLIGSVHFLEYWGYDDTAQDWLQLNAQSNNAHYTAYFHTWQRMIESGLFHIAAHPDLIKIFSIEAFTAWIARPESLQLVGEALSALKKANMAMEISSAGLRKPCREIYPCASIMALAADIGVSISFASDAHSVEDVAADFDILAAYARKYGYAHSVWYCKGHMYEREF